MMILQLACYDFGAKVTAQLWFVREEVKTPNKRDLLASSTADAALLLLQKSFFASYYLLCSHQYYGPLRAAFDVVVGLYTVVNFA